VCACDIAVSDPDHSIASGLKEGSAGGIVGPLIARVVHVTLELYHEPFRSAVEVHDEAVQDMLATEFQAEHGASAKQGPRVSLGRGWVQPELTREREPLGGREPAQRVHRATVAHAAPGRVTRTTHPRVITCRT
jgi:hypothetical protein